MAEDSDLSTANFDNQVDIEALISAPLVAASKANVMMLTGQTRFLLEYCFNKEGDTYKPVMINMVMSRATLIEEEDPENSGKTIKNFKEEKLTFGVPLLCLVPINSMAINKVNVDFEIEITSANTWNSTPSNNSTNNITEKKVALKGKIKNDAKGEYKSSMSSKLTVNITAEPLPLPLGLLSIMDLYSKSIQPLPINPDSSKTKNK
jgi:hypothetical protein